MFITDYLTFGTLAFLSKIIKSSSPGTKEKFRKSSAYFLQYILRYRKKVLDKNLTNSFPNYTRDEKLLIVNDYYQRLSTMIFETIELPHIDESLLAQRFVYTNPKILNHFFVNQRDVLLLTGHFFNWEMGLQAGSIYCEHKIIGVYKTLKNKRVNQLIYKNRSINRIQMVDQQEFIRTINKKSDQPRVFMVIADQNPQTAEKLLWYNFLNQETAFNSALGKIACRYDIPVYYAKILKNDHVRIKYTLEMQEISNEPSLDKADNIIKKYKDLLEENVKIDPSNWVWSHKRWKRKRVTTTP